MRLQALSSIFFVFFFIVACGDTETSQENNGDQGCDPGSMAACLCPDGTSELQMCGDNGTYEACPCGIEEDVGPDVEDVHVEPPPPPLPDVGQGEPDVPPSEPDVHPPGPEDAGIIKDTEDPDTPADAGTPLDTGIVDSGEPDVGVLPLPEVGVIAPDAVSVGDIGHGDH